MRGRAKTMTFRRAESLGDALRLLAENPRAIPLAGGTDYMVLWNAGLKDGQAVIDISGLRELRFIRERDGGLEIGALATHAELRDSPAVLKKFPLLSRACATVGGEQIQNRGTLGGNIANASPAGDTFPCLSVYEAVVRVAGPRGNRRVPFDSFCTGVKRTVLEPGELIEAVELPPCPKPARSLFRKVGTRAAQAISKTCAAGLLYLNKDGSAAELRFSLGSVAPTVRRLRSAEAYLAGRKLTRAAVSEAAALVERDISPIDDVRSTREYRLEVSRNLLRGFLEA